MSRAGASLCRASHLSDDRKRWGDAQGRGAAPGLEDVDAAFVRASVPCGDRLTRPRAVQGALHPPPFTHRMSDQAVPVDVLRVHGASPLAR